MARTPLRLCVGGSRRAPRPLLHGQDELADNELHSAFRHHLACCSLSLPVVRSASRPHGRKPSSASLAAQAHPFSSSMAWTRLDLGRAHLRGRYLGGSGGLVVSGSGGRLTVDEGHESTPSVWRSIRWMGDVAGWLSMKGKSPPVLQLGRRRWRLALVAAATVLSGIELDSW
nr:unnamed protein product [Digitaria exilis]